MIPTVTVSADKNPDFSTDPGSATKDQVFLLSITEANKYFNSDGAMKCEPSDYVVAKIGEGESGHCRWWLRSPGRDQGYAAHVTAPIGNTDAFVFLGGNYVQDGYTAVRPAMWIDLNH